MTIEKTEKKIQNSSRLTPDRKSELLGLLNDLNGELAEMEDVESASRIKAHAHASAGKAAENAADTEDAVKNFEDSVSEFEVSHPKLVQVVNRICVMLSDIGI